MSETISIAMPQMAVTCRGVVRDFGDGESSIRVLHGIDMDVPAGQMTLLVGPSGCGKTTLISIICGLLDPSEGQVTLLGESRRELQGNRLVQFRGKNIGFIFQQYNLLPSLTAAENAALPLIINGIRRDKAVLAAREMLKQVGMENRADALPSQLSGGQQQRVAIARALVHRPRLLVCDEPTAALDAQSGKTVMDMLRSVAVQPDCAVLIVTHDNRIFDYGDRIVHMSDGRIEHVEIRRVEENVVGKKSAERKVRVVGEHFPSLALGKVRVRTV